MTLDPKRVKDLISKFPDQQVVVLGDLMLDRFLYGGVERISPEAPVPVVQVRGEEIMPGGASNVARNVRALDGQASVAGLCGDDPAGKSLSDWLEEDGIDTAGLVRSTTVRTTEKLRIIADRQQVVRVDWDPSNELSASDEAALALALQSVIPGASAVVIEDYGKGVVSQELVRATLDAAARAGVPVGFDPKDNHELDVAGVTIATPNRKEAFHAAGIADRTPGAPPLEDDNLKKVGEILYRKWGAEYLLITLGAQGMLLLHRDEAAHHVPTRAREVFDVSGAGDTVISVVLLTLAAGGTPIEAAELANAAAGIVVGKLGTATCSRSELEAFLS